MATRTKKNVKAVNRTRKGKSNPASDATAMYESFHGLPSEETLTFFESDHFHSNLAALGVLVELKVKLVNGGKTVINFDREGDGRVTVNPSSHGLSLMDQLFPSRKYVKVKTYPTEIEAQKSMAKLKSQGISGRVDRVGRLPKNYKWEVWGLRKDVEGKVKVNGKKSGKGGKGKGPIRSAGEALSSVVDWADSKLAVNGKGKGKRNPEGGKIPTMLCSNESGTQLYFLGGDQSLPLPTLGITGPQSEKELIEIGSVTHITYHTTKKFGAKPETFDYIHNFSEDSHGPQPTLAYDRLNKRLSLVGGVYFIEKPMLGTSPGIED